MTSAVSIRPTKTRRRSRRNVIRVAPSPAPRPAPVHQAERRLRQAGGPQDHAAYTCSSCGCLFEANVSTSVNCPSCGTLQSW